MGGFEEESETGTISGGKISLIIEYLTWLPCVIIYFIYLNMTGHN